MRGDSGGKQNYRSVPRIQTYAAAEVVTTLSIEVAITLSMIDGSMRLLVCWIAKTLRFHLWYITCC